MIIDPGFQASEEGDGEVLCRRHETFEKVHVVVEVLVVDAEKVMSHGK